MDGFAPFSIPPIGGLVEGFWDSQGRGMPQQKNFPRTRGGPSLDGLAVSHPAGVKVLVLTEACIEIVWRACLCERRIR